MKESRKKFIKRAHAEACEEWKVEIEGEFPKVFAKEEYIVGEWYKIVAPGHELPAFILYSNTAENGIGFNHGHNWTTRYNSATGFTDYQDTTTLATEEELEELFLAEAIKRGFVVGVNYTDADGSTGDSFKREYNGTLRLKRKKAEPRDHFLGDGWGGYVFCKDTWGEVDSRVLYTVAEAEAEFNIRINK